MNASLQPRTKTSSGLMSLCSLVRWSSISSPTSSELWVSHTGMVVAKGSGLRKITGIKKPHTVLIGHYDYLGTNRKDIIVIGQKGHFWVNWRCDGLSET